MDPNLELPHGGELPPPMLPPASEITWLPRRRRHTPRHQRAPWADPRIANIVQRAATPAFVQKGESLAVGVTSDTITLSAPMTQGNYIVVWIQAAGSPTFSSLVDTKGNQYAQLTSTTNTASGGGQMRLFAAPSAVGGSSTLTLTFTAVATFRWVVEEYSGVGSIAGNRDVRDGGNGGFGSALSNTFTLPPQQAASLVIMAVGDGAGGTTYTLGSGLSARSASSTTVGLATGDYVASATTTAPQTVSWVATGTTPQYSNIAAVLRPAGTVPIFKLVGLNQTTSAASWTTISYTPKAGATLLAFVFADSPTNTPTAVADATSGPANTWALVSGSRASNASGGELSVWICNGVANAASTSLTVTLSGATTGTLLLVEASGVIPSANLVDIVATNMGNSASASVTAGAAAAIAGETQFFVVAGGFSMASMTPSSGQAYIGGNAVGPTGCLLASTQLLTTTSAPSASGTLSASGQWSAILVTLKTGGLVFTQSQPANTAGATSLSATSSFNTAPGSNRTLVVNVPGGASCTGVTDTQGNAWSLAERATNAANVEVSIWRTRSIVGGKLTVTAAFSASTKAAMEMHGFAGGDTATWFDVGAITTGNGQTVSLTNPQPNYLLRLVIAAGGDGGTGRAYASAAPFAQPEGAISTNANLGVGLATVFEPGVVPTPTSTTLAIPGGANVQYAGAIAAFKIAGSGAYIQGITTTNSGQGSDAATGLLTHSGVTATNAGQGSDAATGLLAHLGVTTTNPGVGSTASTGRLYHYGVTTTNPGVGSGTVTVAVASTRTVSVTVLVRSTVAMTGTTRSSINADIRVTDA